MKKLLSVLMCFALLLGSIGFAACTPNSESNGNVLKVGMECGYDPFNWTQSDNANGAVAIKNVSGKYVNGYDVQIAKQVADYLGMKLEIYMYEWESLVPAVKSGALDAIIAGMSPTEERKEQIDFSANYYQSNLVVVTRQDNSLSGYTTLAEVDKEGIKIAAQPGTFHLQALKEQTSNLTVVETFEDFVLMKVALENGTIDGYIAEEPTAMAFCRDSSAGGVKLGFVPLMNNDTGFTTEEGDTAIAIGVKKGSSLKAKMDEYLATLTPEYWMELMNQMCDLVEEKNKA